MKVTNLFTEMDREVFDRIDRDCIAMHVPTPPKTFLKLEVRDGAGELTDVYEDRAHSWVRNGYNVLMSVLTQCPSSKTGSYGAGSLSAGRFGITPITPIANSSYLTSPRSDFSGGGWNGAVNDSSYGIVVGSSSAVESFESVSLGSHITNGTTSGKLVYSAGSPSNINSYDSGTKKMRISHSRMFNNNSGANVVVAETGIVFSTAVGGIMVCRDVLADAKTVPNAGQLTVTYTIEMTFPE